jgi:hypothetical protein
MLFRERFHYFIFYFFAACLKASEFNLAIVGIEKVLFGITDSIDSYVDLL